MHGFEVRGFVGYVSGDRPISGAQIYELYKDGPVAVTDDKGEFKYDTGSDAPVEIYATKNKYYQTSGNQRITKSDSTKRFEFTLMDWYEKDGPFKIYTVLKGDKDCILNAWVNIGNQCTNSANEYSTASLDPEKRICGPSGGLYPNSDGAVIVRHLVPTMFLFEGQWDGAYVFLQEPDDDVFYYEVSQDDIDRYIEGREQWFKFGQYLGEYKEYRDFDEYKRAYTQDFYKYCPTKLNDIKRSKNEQSSAGRGLTALTIAATGIGGMELAQGLAEQQADKQAERDMDAYIATFRCEYGDGKSVKGGTKAIELPGGNSSEMMRFRTEYFSLMSSLKERKESLGMPPGIEADVVLDKAFLGLYDNEGIGKTDGASVSLYRARMGDESDQAKINEEKEKSAKRVKGGAIAMGGGIAVGLIGNNLINNQNETSDKITNTASQDAFPWETEPTKCSYSECLAKLTISERTKKEPRYGVITDFCSKQFPNNQDCAKIMLMYSQSSGVVLDVDTLLANNYDMTVFQRMTKGYCDMKVCTSDETGRDTILFSDGYYQDMDAITHNRKLKTNLEKCLKIAGASNYFDLPVLEYDGKGADIDFTKLDCSKLDDGKTDSDINVAGTDVTKFLKEEPYKLWERVKLLFGRQSDLVHIIKNN